MLILHLPLPVLSFSEKLSSFELVSKVTYTFPLCTHFFQENINASLMFAINMVLLVIDFIDRIVHVWNNNERACNSQICNEQDCFGELKLVILQ